MTTEDYVSLEVAKLLKEKGFKEWCSYFYGTAVRHNGEDIDEDEEYELKAEGRGDEIEYVEGGHLYHFNCNNSKEDINIWACPTQSLAMKWLRRVHNVNIDIASIWNQKRFEYQVFVVTPENAKQCYVDDKLYLGYEEAVEAALKYSLENLI